MNEMGLILAVLAGIIVGITGGLLFLTGRNRRIEELQGELQGLVEEAAALRDKLAIEIERRAVAEEKSSRVPGLEEDLGRANQENTTLQARLSELETRLEDERKSGEEKLALLLEAKEQLKMESQNVANKIFEEKSQKFTVQNKENLDSVLKPVREQLSEFKKKLEEV